MTQSTRNQNSVQLPIGAIVCLAIWMVMLTLVPAPALAGGERPSGEISAKKPGDLKIACETVVLGEGQAQRIALVCEGERIRPEKVGKLPVLKNLCRDATNLVTSTNDVNRCVDGCEKCTLSSGDRDRLDKDLDKMCSQACRANQTCDPSQTCISKAVINDVVVPTCIPRARGCRGLPGTPDLCVKVEITAECTCGCVL